AELLDDLIGVDGAGAVVVHGEGVGDLVVQRPHLPAGDVVDGGARAARADVDPDHERSLGVLGRDVESGHRGLLRWSVRGCSRGVEPVPGRGAAGGPASIRGGGGPGRGFATGCQAPPRDHASTDCPRCSPSAQPGGIANTAEPIGVVHWFSRSSASSRCWIGTNWPSTSAWKDTKICPASESAVLPGGGASS